MRGEQALFNLEKKSEALIPISIIQKFSALGIFDISSITGRLK